MWILLIFVAQAAVFQDHHFELFYDDTAWERPAQRRASQAPEDRDHRLMQNVILNLQRKAADNRYHPRFSIVIEDAGRFQVSDPKGQSRYYDYVVGFLKSQRFQDVSQKAVQISARPGIEITGFQRDFGLKYRQWAVLDGDRAYLLTAAARADKFEGYAAEWETMVRSFRLLPEKSSRAR